jgi:MFS transporter, MFS domain-containing protein family, molybdate-anion transporter
VPSLPVICCRLYIYHLAFNRVTFLALECTLTFASSPHIHLCRALDVLLVMSGLLLVTGILCSFYVPEDEKEDKEYMATHSDANGKDSKKSSGSASSSSATDAERHHKMLSDFHSFRFKYITVYAVIMLADWMQGTHMYTLYMSYGVNVSVLFLTGFLSGGLFAPFLGSFVDKFGRKRSCIVYCLLEIAINVMEGYENFTVLMIGRVMGGVSTNLLFSAFESWLATQHRHHGFPEEWLSRIYSQCSVVNGSMAVFAGIVAQFLEDSFGHIGPFYGAVGLTTLALALVIPWEENYGEERDGDHANSSITHQFMEGWRTTVNNSSVWKIGLTQALSEGAMYTFVFMWVPTLLSLKPPGGVPTGCVFSSLMMAITIGGLVFPPLQALVAKVAPKGAASEVCASLVYALAGLSMFVPVLCVSGNSFLGREKCQVLVVTSFLLVEFCVGLFMPVAGTLRSKYVPDALQGAILNIFRLPLNTVVVLGTHATEVFEASIVFKMVSACFFAASILQASMIKNAASSKVVTNGKKTD